MPRRLLVLALLAALTACASAPPPPPPPAEPEEALAGRIALLVATSGAPLEYLIGVQPAPTATANGALPDDTVSDLGAALRIIDHQDAPWTVPELLGTAGRIQEAVAAGDWAARGGLTRGRGIVALPVELRPGGFPARYARTDSRRGHIAFLGGITAAGAIPGLSLRMGGRSPDAMRGVGWDDVAFLRAASSEGVGLIVVSSRHFERTGDGAETMRLLRRDVGFDGVVAVDLGPIPRGSAERIAMAALAAGADLILGAEEAMAESISGALNRGEIPVWRVTDALRRVETLLRTLEDSENLSGTPPPAPPERLVMHVPAERRALPPALDRSHTVAVLYAQRDRILADRLVERLHSFVGLVHPVVVDAGRLPIGGEGPVIRATRSADAILLIGSSSATPTVLAAQEAETAGRTRTALIAFGEDDPPAVGLPVLWSPHADDRGLDALVDVLRGAAEPSSSPTRFLASSTPRVSRMMPARVGMSDDSLRVIDRLVQTGLDEGRFTGAVVAVGRRGGLVRLRGYGRLSGDLTPVVGEETPFDMASLTKVVGTTTAVMLLIDDGLIGLHTPVQHRVPEFVGPMKGQVTVRHLLEHSSGLPAGGAMWRTAASPEDALGRIMETPLQHVPGERYLYSDWGMVVLATLVERVAGEPLDAFLERRLFEPLDLEGTYFLPSHRAFPAIAPTLPPGERPFERRGIVHDPNAFRLGGVAGHAGLFSTARDLSVFAQLILNRGSYGSLRLMRPEIVEQFLRYRSPDGRRALGWEVARERNSGGPLMAETGAVGHTGYTGTSIWIDPERELFVILLTNRTYTGTGSAPIVRLRREVNDAAVRAIVD